MNPVPRLFAIVSIFCALLGSIPAAAQNDAGWAATRSLAEELVGERQWAPAALEYRRLALDDPGHAAVWRWMAAWSYAQSPDANDRQRVPGQLDFAEDAATDAASLDWAIPALRGEWFLRDDDPAVARFHFQSAAEAPPPGGVPADWAARAAAVAALRSGDLPRARNLLADSPEALAALDTCTPIPCKRPWLGGLLGVVPGLGYAYSGEWGNATRSLLLNAIFIWAMAQTAHEDQWGLFACSTFLEITWYSGSIYGGIDAAERWNERQFAETAAALRGPEPFPVPDLAVLPILRFEF